MNTAKWARLAKAYFHYMRRHADPGYFPLRVWVEVTNRCNLKCPMCPNKDIPDQDKGLMDFDLYKKIMDQVGPRANDIYLFHRGEPLLHPRLADMIAYAKKSAATVRIHTNGTLLDKDKTEQLIASGLDFISFSFDGYHPAAYEQNRVNSKFEPTLQSIIDFLKTKKERKSRRPYTVLQVIEYESGKDVKKQRQAFLKQFEGLPLDRFVTRKPHNWGGLVETAAPKHKGYVPCTFLWYALVVLYNGDVLPCPQDFSARLKLGNIQDSSLEAIFHGPKMQDLRQRIAKKEVEGLVPCQTCDRLRRNTFLGLPTDYLKSFIKDHLGAA